MAWDPAVDAGVIRPAILDDDLSFFEMLLVRPDLVAGDVVFLADGRAWEGTSAGWPLAVGWRRGRGPVILGAATGAATEPLMLATLHLAGASSAWDLEEWDERVAAWWEDAAPEVRERVEERWTLPAAEPWDVTAWTRAVWGEEPAVGRATVGVVATRLPDAVRSTVAWLAAREAAVAFAIRWYGADASPVPRLDLVEGSWEAAWPEPEPMPVAVPEQPEPVQEKTAQPVMEAAPARVAAPEPPPRGAAVLDTIEAIARETGARVSRNSEWMRIEGPRRALRVFPADEWVDLQLVGLDEGSLVGLRYRHGVPLNLEPGPEAPPGVHLRITDLELGPAVTELLRSWLSTPAPEAEKPPRKSRTAAPARRPRNPRPHR